MALPTMIDSTGASALVPLDTASRIISNLPEQSAALKLFTHVPLSTKTTRLPVLSMLPQSSFRSGETGQASPTKAQWEGRDLVVEDITTVVPIPKDLLADAAFDIWGALEPSLVQSIGATLDRAVFLGTNKPSTWPTAVVPAAVAAGNIAVRGTKTTANGGLAADISDMFGLVEDVGFDVNGVVASRTYRGLIRNARDSQGRQLAEVGINEWYGVPVSYALSGGWATGDLAPEAFAGDFSQGILGVRQDISYQMVTEGVISDGSGVVTLNLPLSNAVALVVTSRFAFQVANAVTLSQPTEADRYPFAVIEAPDLTP